MSAEKHSGGGAHGSFKSYVAGLCLSLLLTAVAFGVVILEFNNPMAITIILLSAIAQIFVQLVFFLHMNTSSESIWNTTSTVFIVLIVAIVVLGSIWIMNHLNHNMLLGH